MTGIVVKKLANDFWVKVDNSVFVCRPRGNLKANGVFVGDNVEINKVKDFFVIDKIQKRKNLLIRPPIANLEQLFIVVSPVPKPDFMIVDKLILFAYSYGITPIIVTNKQDLSTEVIDYVKNVYSNFVQTLNVSAKTGYGINDLIDIMKGKISAFSGQSAVGKSALINAIFKDNYAEEGELSERINRGKNTTRHSQIHFDIKNDIMIADTSGFTSLDEKLLPIAYFELPYYYRDYNVYKNQCKYTDCTHIEEDVKDCKIKQLVEENKLDKDRYYRYKAIYKILEQKWVKTHG